MLAKKLCQIHLPGTSNANPLSQGKGGSNRSWFCMANLIGHPSSTCCKSLRLYTVSVVQKRELTVSAMLMVITTGILLKIYSLKDPDLLKTINVFMSTEAIIKSIIRIYFSAGDPDFLEKMTKTPPKRDRSNTDLACKNFTIALQNT